MKYSKHTRERNTLEKERYYRAQGAKADWAEPLTHCPIASGLRSQNCTAAGQEQIEAWVKAHFHTEAHSDDDSWLGWERGFKFRVGYHNHGAPSLTGGPVDFEQKCKNPTVGCGMSESPNPRNPIDPSWIPQYANSVMSKILCDQVFGFEDVK